MESVSVMSESGQTITEFRLCNKKRDNISANKPFCYLFFCYASLVKVRVRDAVGALGVRVLSPAVILDASPKLL